MSLFKQPNIQMYYLYTSNGNLDKYTRYDLDNLNILRFDATEKQILEYRKKQYTKINKQSENLICNRILNSDFSKIAFISRDFHERRPSGQLTIKFFKLIKELFPKIKIFFYMHLNSPLSDYFKTLATVVANQDLDLLKEQVLNDEIDILIDMQGHMHNNFNKIFNYRLAPIQMHWLGYPGTLGIETIDYLVADETIVPKESQPYYVEKMAYLPNCYQCNNDDLLVTTSNLKRSDFNIPDDAFAFCHFNHEYKLDRKTWFVWMSILKRVPNSVLVFTTFDKSFVKILNHDASLFDIDNKRLIWVKYERNREKHFNRINLCNLGLDCYRLNGHTSSSDLIASGIPLITYTSDTYHNRVAKSILKAVDLEELVCYSFEEYANLAVRLATNKNYYNSVRNKVIENRTKYLFNTKLYVENFMNMLHRIWDEKLNSIHDNEKVTEVINNDDKDNNQDNIIQIINKDYSLPIINLVINIDNNNTLKTKVMTILNYLVAQYYLNVHVNLIIFDNINTTNLIFLNEMKHFHNVSYHKNLPDSCVNKIFIDNELFISISKDLYYFNNYYNKNKDKLKNISINEFSDNLDISEIYQMKIKTINELKIDNSKFFNLPHIYWINLDRSIERAEKINTLFIDYSLENSRITAHDYLDFDNFSANYISEPYDYEIRTIRKQNEDNNKNILKNNKMNIIAETIIKQVVEDNYNSKIIDIENAKNNKKKELSCLSSHLKAMSVFLETSNDDYCIIAEDDLSIEYAKFWNKSYWEYLEDLPDDWECIQLTQIIPIQHISAGKYLYDRLKVIPYKDNFSWSTTAYMINRKGAQKLLDSVKIFDNKYYFKNITESIADVYIYKYLNTYTIPLFTYMNEDESTINNNSKHLSTSKKLIDNIWINNYEANKE